MGTIGPGGQGMGNTRGFLNLRETQIVAVCDVDSTRRKAAASVVNKHYSNSSSTGDFQGCDEYNDFRELLDREDIDAVIVSTPDHWHALISIAAAKAGKDIYCEKPLTHSVLEGRVLSDTVRRHSRVFQTGSQQRSSWMFRLACELVQSGRIGKLIRMEVGLPGGRAAGDYPAMPVPEGFDYDLWLGPAPFAPYHTKRCHYNFRFNFDYAGAQMTNWGAHHFDIAQWGNGTDLSGPVSVDGKGTFPNGGLYNTPLRFKVEYTYANGVTMSAGHYPNGVKFIGTDGWVFVDRSKVNTHPKEILESPIGPDEIHLYESTHHHRNFLDCVKSRRPTAAPVEIAHRSVTIGHIGNISMLLRRPLKWDPKVERFVDDDEANRMLSRPMRPPWHL